MKAVKIEAINHFIVIQALWKTYSILSSSSLKRNSQSWENMLNSLEYNLNCIIPA